MAYSTLSDPFVAAAFWTGISALLLTLVLSAEIVLLRIRLRRDERREKRVIEKWRPILNAALAEMPFEALPRLRRAEHIPFLRLWVHLHASVRGTGSTALNTIGYPLGIDGVARTLLRKGNRAERLLAVLALGHLRDPKAWPLLMREAGEADSTTSLYAMWALVQIDAPLAAEHMTPFFVERDDWALSQVVTILQDARESCAPVLARIIPSLDHAQLARALRIAEALRISLPPALHAGLLHSDDVEVLVGALRVSASPQVLVDIRRLAAHEDWRVRVQVAKTLGRIGEREDVALLNCLLADRQWWVRYRAAQSLVGLPFFTRAALLALVDAAADRFAADMLRQVMAERSMA